MDEKLEFEEALKSQPVETDKAEGEEKTSLPQKFKDVTALLNAYNSLQSEFTKRCQKIKELEGRLNADKENTPAQEQGTEQTELSGITKEDKMEILKDYLKDVCQNGQKVIVMGNDGVGVKAPVNKPKSIKEAGLLAKQIL